MFNMKGGREFLPLLCFIQEITRILLFERFYTVTKSRTHILHLSDADADAGLKYTVQFIVLILANRRALFYLGQASQRFITNNYTMRI